MTLLATVSRLVFLRDSESIGCSYLLLGSSLRRPLFLIGSTETPFPQMLCFQMYVHYIIGRLLSNTNHYISASPTSIFKLGSLDMVQNKLVLPLTKSLLPLKPKVSPPSEQLRTVSEPDTRST